MRYIVSKAPGIGGPAIPEDEPCLVVRAQDVLAPAILKNYIRLANDLGVSEDVLTELDNHLDTLYKWRDENRFKLKLADR